MISLGEGAVPRPRLLFNNQFIVFL